MHADATEGPRRDAYDAVVIGSGPNGLGAAITLARAGWSVLVLEAQPTLGGGVRSAELTLPGFVHDICSAIYPMGAASSLFLSLLLHEHGLEWVHPEAPLAHPLDDGSAVLLERSVAATGKHLGEDADAYRRLFGPLVDRAGALFADAVGPLRIPRHPILMTRFGLRSLWSARHLTHRWFRGERARALFAGLAGHQVIPLDLWFSAAVGMMLGVAGHAVGWPLVRGGAQRLTDALVSYFRSLGGEIVANCRVTRLEDLPRHRAVLFDTIPRTMLSVCGEALPARYHRTLQRYRHGPGVFKLDYALDGPIPWKAAECARAGTVHLGGTFEEIATSERDAWEGRHCTRPYMLVAQQSLFDPSRAPAGKHTAWAYCHVPNGSTEDMTDVLEAQLERFAPGFRERVLARHVMSPRWLHEHNENYVGGDISGGAADMWQLFTRPAARIVPYSTPTKGIFLCSSSTPPGGGVHGLGGYFAARAALRSTPAGYR